MDLFRTELRREFIARPDASKGQIVYKWPDTTIRKFTQLTVEPDEMVLFVRDGTVRGTVLPGRVTLDNAQLPFLGALIDAATGANLFKAEVYFVSTREFPDLPFGGMVDNVVDPDTSLAVGLRVFGEYSLKVTDPQALILNLVGSRNLLSNDQITDWMREQVLKTFRTDVVTHITANEWPILGIAARSDAIEAETLDKVQAAVAPYGVQIARMGNFTISLSPQDEETLKNFRRDVSYTKLAGSFQQYGAGEALRGIGEGAAKGGGTENAAMFGIAMGLGNVIAGAAGTPAAGTAAAGATAAGAAAPAATMQACPQCGAMHAVGAKFCANCGAAIAAVPVHCTQCGTEAAPGAKFCASCGAPLQAPPNAS
jgi:membrane protease subunit (stomatin/prohibitin family)